jgi:hypothetical protein
LDDAAAEVEVVVNDKVVVDDKVVCFKVLTGSLLGGPMLEPFGRFLTGLGSVTWSTCIPSTTSAVEPLAV